jgi:hypothetical protein
MARSLRPFSLVAVVLCACSAPPDDPLGRVPTERKFRAIPLGMTPEHVERVLGKPFDTHGGSSKVWGPNRPGVTCSEYNTPSDRFYYEVCYANGEVMYKAIEGRDIV